MTTKQRLADELTKAKAPHWMVYKALDGYYDDFQSEIPTPIIQLIMDCSSVGLNDFAERAKNGEFDSTKEEADEWYQKEGKDLLK